MSACAPYSMKTRVWWTKWAPRSDKFFSNVSKIDEVFWVDGSTEIRLMVKTKPFIFLLILYGSLRQSSNLSTLSSISLHITRILNHKFLYNDTQNAIILI